MKNLSITEALSVHLHLTDKKSKGTLGDHEQEALRDAWNVIESFGRVLVQERRVLKKATA